MASIKQSVLFAEQLAQGNLTRQLSIGQEDEVGDLVNAMNRMISSLGKMFSEFSEKSENIAESLDQMVGQFKF